jgi:hypothetical protein
MYVWAISSSSEKDLANQIASYLRRGYKVVQIIYSDIIDKKPYKAFLLRPDILDENLDSSEGYIVNLDEKILGKNIYEITCKIPKDVLEILKIILYGNTDNLLKVNGKNVFFEIVLPTDNKLILKNAFDAKTNKKIQLDQKDIQYAICKLIKDL